MDIVSENKDLLSVFVIFTVELEHQQALVDTLLENFFPVVRTRQGFVSANLHKSLDGKSVINYAQWRSSQDYQAFSKSPEAQELGAKLMGFIKSSGAKVETQTHTLIFTTDET